MFFITYKINKLKSIYKKVSKNVFNAITFFFNAIIPQKQKIQFDLTKYSQKKKCILRNK